MPIVVKNYFSTTTNVEFAESTSAERVGRRIKKIRQARGMSQAELGARVDLNADRIRKYENGVRKPKIDLLKRIASVLQVEVDALADPNVATYTGVMFALFDLEENFDLEPVMDNGRVRLQFGDGIFDHTSDYIRNWYEAKQRFKVNDKDSEKERERKREEYNNWKWTYPQALVDETNKGFEKIRIQKQIDELQQKLKELEEEE